MEDNSSEKKYGTEDLRSQFDKSETLLRFGCVMLKFRSQLIDAIQGMLDPEDVIKLEEDHHVTLLYGIHHEEVTPLEVLDRVDNMSLNVMVALENLSLFTNGEQDVLKLNATGHSLANMNARLRQLPHTTDYPDYKPHATIAYMVKGTGQRFIDDMRNRELTIIDAVLPNAATYHVPGNPEPYVKMAVHRASVIDHNVLESAMFKGKKPYTKTIVPKTEES